MKKFNIDLKNRKTLSLLLCLVLVCVFTLTIAYSALSAVLTINGNARVSAANWDIYLSNPRVTSGSATTNLPVIKTSSTLEFETTLNMPGDFYEFVVDVVNGGDLDAMIENVVKNPELTVEQEKYLKYEVLYENGESITTKQTLFKDTSMPIKVRIEYRKDLSNNDLPTGQVVLDLSLTLEYIQSDGTGSLVTNNGAEVKPIANGDINKFGTIVTIGTEQFYTMGTQDNNVKLLSMYNLYVGNIVDSSGTATPIENPTGKQDSSARAYVRNQYPHVGTVEYANDKQTGYPRSSYRGSVVEIHVNNYKNILESEYGIVVEEARLITKAEATDSKTFHCEAEYYTCVNGLYRWIYSTSFWMGYSYDNNNIYVITSEGYYDANSYITTNRYGVRPVIVISKDYFS